MKLVATSREEQEISAVDPWTAVHLSAGLSMGLLDVGFWEMLVVNVGYELLENYVQRREVGKTFFGVSTPEHPANAVVDVVAVMAGWYLGQRWNET